MWAVGVRWPKLMSVLLITGERVEFLRGGLGGRVRGPVDGGVRGQRPTLKLRS